MNVISLVKKKKTKKIANNITLKIKKQNWFYKINHKITNLMLWTFN